VTLGFLEWSILGEVMARGPCSFKQRDLTRAIRGAVAAGQIVERALIDADGRIMLGFATNVSGGGHEPANGEQDGNPWDEALAS
jgi:hypothetical protein